MKIEKILLGTHYGYGRNQNCRGNVSLIISVSDITEGQRQCDRCGSVGGFCRVEEETSGGEMDKERWMRSHIQ